MEDLSRLEALFPDLAKTRDWAILKETLLILPPEQLGWARHEAEKTVAWQEKPVSLLRDCDDRITMVELYAAFNDRLPMWVLGIIQKEDFRPSEVPARAAREQINKVIVSQGLDRRQPYAA